MLDAMLVKTHDVCGGRIRIDGTRITVHRIATLYKQGQIAEDIVHTYPHLSLGQIYTALAYYHANREEIEADLAAADAEYDELKDQQRADEKNHERGPSVCRLTKWGVRNVSYVRLAAVLSVIVMRAAVSQAVTIATVPVGNRGNATDSTVMQDGTSGYGSVAYAYRIGKFEVTNSQYVEFLNAKAAMSTTTGFIQLGLMRCRTQISLLGATPRLSPTRLTSISTTVLPIPNELTDALVIK
jgi:uncharacterized protein (DUF433 family)